MENMKHEEMISLLQWYLDSGVDEATDDETLDWFALSAAPVQKEIQTKIPQTKPLPILSVDQNIQIARDLANGCDSPAALNEALRHFEGCRLKKTATHTVFAQGNPASDIMLIGDPPAALEDRQGKVFAGDNEQILSKMFKAIRYDCEQNFYLTTVLPWRPPGNRAPTPEEIAVCMPFLKRHIELFSPKIIILLGGVAANALLEKDAGIARLRGRWMDYDLGESKIPVRTLFHPAYLLKQPKAKKDTWADLLDIKVRMESLSL